MEIPSRRSRTPRIVVLQSCDETYLPLFRVTSPVNEEYAKKHAYVYRQLVGNISQVPHTANFNRYYLLRDEIEAKCFDWAAWLDSDALVIDHAVKLESIIDNSPEKMLIACRGADRGSYDINNGVFLINLRHPQALSMIEYVIAACERIPPANTEFCDDQCHMHCWLSQRADAGGDIAILRRYTDSETSLFNYDGSFIRHVLRGHGSLEKRVEELQRLKRLVQG